MLSVAINHSISLLHSIPFYEDTVIYSSILLMMGVWGYYEQYYEHAYTYVCISTAVQLLGHKRYTSSALVDNA